MSSICFSPRMRGFSVNLGWSGAEQPTSAEYMGTAANRRDRNHDYDCGCAVARSRAWILKVVNMGLSFAPPQGGVPGRASRLGCETLRYRRAPRAQTNPAHDDLIGPS